MSDLQTQDINTVTGESLKRSDLAETIGANLANLALRISRWTGRLMLRKAKVESHGADVTKMVTNPRWKLDVHPLFKQLDQNRAAIELVMVRFTTSDSLRGLHLVSLIQAPEALKQLSSLHRQRVALSRELSEVWDEEAIPQIKARVVELLTESEEMDKFPVVWEEVQKLVPTAMDIRGRFGVVWELRPLTPMTAEDLDLRTLSKQDATTLIEDTNAMLREQVERRVDAIVREVFGELNDLCDKVVAGKLESGKIKTGSLRQIMDLLSRLKNFRALASNALLLKADEVEQIVKELDPQDVNRNSNNVQGAIKKAMGALGKELKTTQVALMEGRRERDVEFE